MKLKFLKRIQRANTFFKNGLGKNHSLTLVISLLGFGLFLFAFGFTQYLSRDVEDLASKEAYACLEFENNKELQCLNGVLQRISELEGIKIALAIIEPIVAQNSYMLNWTHPLAHTIGDYGFKYYKNQGVSFEGSIGRALVNCNGFGAFGCYHGVIEVGLSYLPIEDRTQVIRKSCIEDPLIKEEQYFVNQCLHWFGHGMAIFTDQNIHETLSVCEGLNPIFMSDEVQLCLSGVFHAGASPGDVDDSLLNHISNVFDPDDPYYPCQGIAEKFKGHCYSHVPGRVGSSDSNVTFGACHGIPEPDPVKKRDYIRRCYDSAANLLMTMAVNAGKDHDSRIQKIVSDCRAYTDPEFRRYCYGGAVRYWVLFEPNIENTKPFDVCKSVEEEAKPICYGSIGFGNNENYYSREKLEQYCSNAEEEYVQYCLNKYTNDL